MIIENLTIPKVVQENLTDMIKLYIRYGPDYNLIAKQFQGIVEQKISTKFISQFCFNLNKKTYQIIVDYLKQHKEKKGEKQFNYDNLWPPTIDDQQLRTQIQNLPTDIIRILNKDLSEAYNLLMESLSDPTLKKLLEYNRIRDLYQFVTEVILKKKNKPRRERKDKKDTVKETSHKKPQTKIIRLIQKENLQEVIVSPTEWSSTQQRYFCALYLERPLFKCCQKMILKFGQSEKWNTTRKIFKKVEEIFEKSLKKAFKSSYFKSLKHILDDLQMTKQNLLSQIIKKKSNQIQRIVLKYHKTVDPEKRTKILQEISTEILTILQRPDILKKISQQFEIVKKQEQKIKQEEKLPKQIDLEINQPQNIQLVSTQSQNVDEIKLQKVEQKKVDYIELEKVQ